MKRKFLIAAIISFFIAGLVAYGLCSSETTNLGLAKPAKGDRNWGQSINTNMDLIDSAVGTIQSKSDDLPEVYVYTGTFNSTTGYQIALPKSVDSVNEYDVKITPTTRAGAIGDIYVTKTTSNFTVKCSEANTTDTFSAAVYYIGDVSAYGGSIYRKWYVSPDTGITDHGDTSQTGSLAWVLNENSTTPATVELPGNKSYQLLQNLTITSNIQLMLQMGAVIDMDFSIRNSNYEWYQNGATSEYYLQASGGGNPNINMPSVAIENNAQMIDGTAGSLAIGEWDWNDVNGLGYTTVYVRLSDSTDPDGKSADYVEAGYAVTFLAMPSIISADQPFSGNGLLKIAGGPLSSNHKNVDLYGLSYLVLSSIELISNSRLFNGELTNATPGSDVIQINGTVGSPMADIEIKHLKINSMNDAGSNAIVGDYATNIRIYMLEIDTADSAIYLDHSNNASIKDIYITEARMGVYINNSDYVKTLHNHIVSGYGNSVGITYYGSTNGVIDGNTIYDMGYDGISVNLTSPDNAVTNNNISTCGRYGLIVDSGSTGCRIIGNKLDNVTSTAMAIVENDHEIVGNEIRDCSTTAMTIEDSSNSTVFANRIKNCGTTTSHHGILGYGTGNGINNNSIIGNVIKNVSGGSIYISGSTGGAIGNIISGNNIDSPYRGIIIESTTKTKLANNTITGSGDEDNKILVISSDDIKGDLTLSSSVIDLSGAATSEWLYYAHQQGTVISATIYFTEATSADAGIEVLLGTYSISTKFLNIQAGSATLVSQSINTAITWNPYENLEGVLYGGWLNEGDYIKYSSAGGKVGAGAIIISLEICLHG